MMDWMKTGEKGDGGHTCELGRRVCTGATLTQNRRVEGLILSRAWRGRSNCTGCTNTDTEINKAKVWFKEQENFKTSLKMCGDKSDEKDFKKVVRRWSKFSEDVKEESVKTLLVWMVVAIGRMWIQDSINLSEVK